MIPGGMALSDIPPSADKFLRLIRLACLGVLACQVLLPIVGGPIVDLLAIVFMLDCVFVLRNDPVTGRVYHWLMSTPLEQCVGPSGGGSTCIMSTLFTGLIQAVMLSISLFGRLNPSSLDPLTGQTVAGLYAAYKIWELIKPGSDASVGGGVLNRGDASFQADSGPRGNINTFSSASAAPSGGGNHLGGNRLGGGAATGAAPGGGGGGFVPFGGGGNRLDADNE